ncbi:hypothetical protein C2G38_2051309 [Gigaspora rosea]|uniref:SWIM-type domain-containing protein n=1 Tax=Gigaspora rosea TaxID=44941 RepID=A0A397TS78_9GLOM|nr:hypothetical protein C2G38_2051309 [Gigaspora rosea]
MPKVLKIFYCLQTNNDNAESILGPREYEQDIQYVLFKSLIKNVNQTILKVWNIRATGIAEIGHYVTLLSDGSHLCTCLLLLNKGIICCHFFHVATYSNLATFHIILISSRWYLEPNISQEVLLNQFPFIQVCNASNSENLPPISNFIFEHLFAVRSISGNSRSTTKNAKTVYAELFGLSKKVIDSAIKANVSQKLFDTLKLFLYDMQNQTGKSQQVDDSNVVVNNPNITKHRGRPPKRLKSNVEVEYPSSKSKQILRETNINVSNNKNINAKSSNNGDKIYMKGRTCGRYKQVGHYAKTC